MILNVKNININYDQYGKGDDVILLHGWGQNIEMMNPLGKELMKDYRVTVIDLPGHGNSAEPKEPLFINDFSEILKEILEKLKIKNPIIIGHSFGGRVAIVFAEKYKTKKVVLLAAPCIKKEEPLSLKVKMLKKMKKIPGLSKLENFAKKHIGSPDYRNSSEMMRKVLVNVVNQDLSEYAKKIRVPTLLIWGTEDQQVSIEEAREIEKLIPDSGLVEYEGGTHYAYLEFLKPVSEVIKVFIK